MSTPPALWSSSELLDFARRALRAVGTPTDHAHDMAAQILGSELAGHESHGFRRLPEYVERARSGHADPTSGGVVVSDTGAIVSVDGRGGFGHVVMRKATHLAVDRARRNGIAAVSVRNAEYVGRFADFCADAAGRGVATLVFVTCSGAAQVAGPPGAIEPRLGTNPIAAGVPRAAAPHLVIDMATTAVAMGRVAEWRDRGEEIPREWVNAHGVLQHMAGVKGFALAMLAEALAGALTGAGTVSTEPVPDRQGVLLIALDVAAFRPLDEFAADVEQAVAYVRDVPQDPGSAVVRMPGESLPATDRPALLAVQHFTAAALQRMAAELGITAPAPILDAPPSK